MIPEEMAATLPGGGPAPVRVVLSTDCPADTWHSIYSKLLELLFRQEDMHL